MQLELKPIPAFEVEISSIVVEDRIRKDFGDISDLAEDIRINGLIQPIVVTSTHRLIAGERRLRAHKHLGLSTIKAVYMEVLDEAHLTRLEASENISRRDFTWQEKTLAIDKVHRRMSVESALKSESWGVRETGRLLDQAHGSIGNAIFIAEFLHANDQPVWAADSLKDAFRVVMKRREEEANALLVQSSKPKTPASKTNVAKPVIPKVDFFSPQGTGNFVPGVGAVVDTTEDPVMTMDIVTAVEASIPLSQMLLKQENHNELTTLLSLGADCCDHIITDPPYGIDMEMLDQQNPHGGMGNIGDVTKEHDVVENLSLLARFIPAAYTAIRPNGFLVMFADAMNWQFLYDTCIAAGFKVQRWPLVWHKTSSCMNQTAQYNFTKNLEIAIVCRKGNATLVKHQPSSIWTGGNDTETKLLGHPFAKPAGLWKWVYSACCLRGSEVLDPFVGVGSSILPAIELGLRPRGIECSDVHYGRLVNNVQSYYKSISPNVTFS